MRPAVPPSEPTPYKSPAGFHRHACICGHVWEHADSCHGKRREHACPACGEIEWSQHLGGLAPSPRITTMSCPTCSETMQGLDDADQDRRRFWCPRCGTLKRVDRNGFEEVELPKIVERVRLYQKDCIVAGYSTMRSVRMWFTMGLPESIDVPSDRPS